MNRRQLSDAEAAGIGLFVWAWPDGPADFTERLATLAGWGFIDSQRYSRPIQDIAGAARWRTYTPFIDDDDDLKLDARDRFNREDHYAHVLAGWEHHHAYAHLEPNIDLPF